MLLSFVLSCFSCNLKWTGNIDRQPMRLMSSAPIPPLLVANNRRSWQVKALHGLCSSAAGALCACHAKFFKLQQRNCTHATRPVEQTLPQRQRRQSRLHGVLVPKRQKQRPLQRHELSYCRSHRSRLIVLLIHISCTCHPSHQGFERLAALKISRSFTKHRRLDCLAVALLALLHRAACEALRQPAPCASAMVGSSSTGTEGSN